MMVEGATLGQGRSGPPFTHRVKEVLTPFICLTNLEKQEVQTSVIQTSKEG